MSTDLSAGRAGPKSGTAPQVASSPTTPTAAAEGSAATRSDATGMGGAVRSLDTPTVVTPPTTTGVNLPEVVQPPVGVFPATPIPPPDNAARTQRGHDRRRLLSAAVVTVVVAGTVLRFATGSHLWLDEALTVEISRRPLPDLFAALRHDGSPPLYYVLLHAWIMVFGTGDIAVRALSGLISLATLPAAWFAGRRVGRVAIAFGNASPQAGERTALAAFLLFASSPYAIRYGSEARMYSLVVLGVLVFGLALMRALERPGWRRWLLLSFTSVAMAYTHYWTFLLLGSVAFFLVVQSRRRPQHRARCRSALLAMLGSGALFVPWLPTFAFQMVHTGTPWAPEAHVEVLLDTVYAWAGPTSTGALLGLLLLAAAFVGLTARPHGDSLHVDLRGRVPGRYLAALWLAPLVLAYLMYLVGGSAYTDRYTGVSLPAFLLLAALGIGVVPDRRLQLWVLVVACVTGLLGGWTLARQERTEAGTVANRIDALARPGDVVAYCPDQLGPAVYRTLDKRGGPPLRQVALADPSGPQLVDWVDYAGRMRAASGADFATRVNALAGPDHAVFLVRADGYRTLAGTCSVVSDQLAARRDRSVLVTRSALLEAESLERFSTTR